MDQKLKLNVVKLCDDEHKHDLCVENIYELRKRTI